MTNYKSFFELYYDFSSNLPLWVFPYLYPQHFSFVKGGSKKGRDRERGERKRDDDEDKEKGRQRVQKILEIKQTFPIYTAASPAQRKESRGRGHRRRYG